MAVQIKELQGEMADYNTLMDKLNTDTEMGAILMDYEVVRNAHMRSCKCVMYMFILIHLSHQFSSIHFVTLVCGDFIVTKGVNKKMTAVG